MSTVPYAELHAHSAFSFLDGASLPEELAAEAARLALSGLALTDHDGLYGVVRLAEAARALALPTVLGAELNLGTTGRAGAHEGPGAVAGMSGRPDPDGTHLLVLARGAEGYRRLARALARGHLDSGVKGRASFDLEDLAAQAGGEWLVLTGCRKGAVRRALAGGGTAAGTGGGTAAGTADGGAAVGGPSDGVRAARAELDRLTALFGRDNVAVEITDTGAPLDSARNDVLAELAAAAALPLVATGAVHCARPADQPLADVLAATRARATLAEIDGWLPTAPAHLRSGAEMAARHHRHPGAVPAAAALAAECAFDLQLVAPDLPPYPVPPEHTEATWLRELTYRGAAERYGPRGAERVPGAYEMIEHELDIITRLHFPGYFLIVHEIVQFCREQRILCQGRGSAANSAVCFALGITAVDAVQHRLLFERFLSPGRSGPPDIDLDIESGRREEVIQHVYARYGREHAAQVANVISYRPRSAVRDAARALGYDVGQQDAWSKSIERWGSLRPADAGRRGAPGRRREGPARDGPGRDEPAPAPAGDLDGIPAPVLDVAEQMLRLPRHLGIHSGGMVLCDRPVIEVCPVEWATMPGRTVLQWDKDDCADAGLVKFDLLGLGMLTALRIAFDAINAAAPAGAAELGLHSLPQEDPAVYDLLCAADTVGVFQVESRAQMATLPRLRPQCFYDIVVEVALIRPGPIQGDSVNPYLNRRRGREAVTYLHPLLEPALAKTLGVPLFQEQLMQIAIDVAGFTPAEADQLRKAMGAKRSEERMAALRGRLLAGMAANGVSAPVAEQIYDKLKAFADFGFPESHAFSFAYLVYASAWLKVHHPEAFYAALLAAQPMGFYSPQSLVADARRHGVAVQRADVNVSAVQATVERVGEAGPADGGAGGGGSADEAAGVAHLVHSHPGLAVRLGLAPVRGVGEQTAERIVAERERGGPFADLPDLARRVDLTAAQLEALATAGALGCFGLERRQALWAAGAVAGEHGTRHTRRRSGPGARTAGTGGRTAGPGARRVEPGARPWRGAGPGEPGPTWYQPPLPGTTVGAAAPELPAMAPVETAVADVWATGVSPSTYPTQFRRAELAAAGVLPVADLGRRPPGERLRVAGVVTHRQRPHTAAGVTFLSLEDETGLLNVVCSAGLWARYRKVARTAAALVVRGVLERADGVTNLVADRIEPLSLAVPATSRDFR
ncbi:error-prone DNA polymerase [Georgenia sp. TF02-10]|uniref:error-prone DNA polymerase n=1 Tax=Georgenia sp. TF02-10 TaxID=2917725 RepID=UPI001FA78DB6|nr:error-prone DNA polymerase [Georgenia sp. TF02-10]UNX56099.1 error-prone DNA polymerase [Georgenia sp. TF02-10]